MAIEKIELKVLMVPEIAAILKKSKQYSGKFLSFRYDCKFSCKLPFSHAPYKAQASKRNWRKRQTQKNSRRTENEMIQMEDEIFGLKEKLRELDKRITESDEYR